MKKVNVNTVKLALISVLILFASHYHVYAGQEITDARLSGSSLLSSTAFLSIEDDKFTGSSSWQTGFINYNNLLKVEFGLDEDQHLFHSSVFTSVIKYDIVLTDALLNSTTLTNQVIEIS